jgi:ankyrin repeat protein
MGSENSKLLINLENILEAKDVASLDTFAQKYQHLLNSPLFYKGTNAMCRAVNQESLEMVEILVKCGADINLASSNGNTPLMWAARNNDIPILDFLISKNAKLEMRNKEGLTAIDLSICNMAYDSSLKLFIKGAQIRSEEEYRVQLGCEFNIHKFMKYLGMKQYVEDFTIFYKKPLSDFII